MLIALYRARTKSMLMAHIALVVGPAAMKRSEKNALFYCSSHVLDLFLTAN